MKKQIITVTVLVFAILIASVVLIVLRGPQQSLQFPSSPTPTPVGSTTNNVNSTVKLISINPADKSENVPLNTKITATLSQTASNVSFVMYPEVPFTISQRAAVTTIVFSQPLEQDTTYSYSLLDADGNIIFTGQFSTGTTANSVAPLSQSYDNLQPIADKAQQENYPDVYLANYTPYEANTFSVNSDFDSQKKHFFFTVLLNQPQGKADFQKWLTSLGLTDPEIQKLDVRYQP